MFTVYGIIGEPKYYPDYESHWGITAKVSYDDGEEIIDDILLFETEEDAWSVYNRASKEFRFLSVTDLNRFIQEGRQDE